MKSFFLFQFDAFVTQVLKFIQKQVQANLVFSRKVSLVISIDFRIDTQLAVFKTQSWISKQLAKASLSRSHFRMLSNVVCAT